MSSSQNCEVILEPKHLHKTMSVKNVRADRNTKIKNIQKAACKNSQSIIGHISVRLNANATNYIPANTFIDKTQDKIQTNFEKNGIINAANEEFRCVYCIKFSIQT